MRIFLDIGGHLGETLEVVQERRWRFDRIYSFEPAPACWPTLEALAGRRTEICRYGLWDRDATLSLHNAGAVGASMFQDKDVSSGAVVCQFKDAAAWFRHNISPEDEVFVKVNVEGAEAELIARLSETQTLGLIDHLLVHFDVRKVPSKRHLEAVIRRQLQEADVEYVAADEIQFGVVGRGTRAWLRWCDASPRTRDLRYKTIGRRVAALRRTLYPLKARLTR